MAYQHYKTFKDRLDAFPVTIDYLSRARDLKSTKAVLEDLKNAFEPYNIKESFLKENIEKMIDIKHKKLVQEFINYDIPKNLANHILNETKIVDENFSKEIKK